MDQILVSMLSVLTGVIVAFVLMLFKDKFEKKRRLKVWKMLVYQELISHKRKICRVKTIIERDRRITHITTKLTLDKAIYDSDFAFNVLGKDISVYLKHIDKVRGFDLCVDKFLEAKVNKWEKEARTQGFFAIESIKSFDTDELSLIINKIGKSLGKDELYFGETTQKPESVKKGKLP